MAGRGDNVMRTLRITATDYVISTALFAYVIQSDGDIDKRYVDIVAIGVGVAYVCVIMALCFVYVVNRVRVVGLVVSYLDWTGHRDCQPATILLSILHLTFAHVNCQHHENTGHVISPRQPLHRLSHIAIESIVRSYISHSPRRQIESSLI